MFSFLKLRHSSSTRACSCSSCASFCSAFWSRSWVSWCAAIVRFAVRNSIASTKNTNQSNANSSRSFCSYFWSLTCTCFSFYTTLLSFRNLFSLLFKWKTTKNRPALVILFFTNQNALKAVGKLPDVANSSLMQIGEYLQSDVPVISIYFIFKDLRLFYIKKKLVFFLLLTEVF